MTKYHVILDGETVEDGLVKKAEATKYADRLRITQRGAVQVVTDAGRVVYDKPAPKHINQSPKYTKRVQLPPGVSIPKGKRPAYIRPRRGGVILHDDRLPAGEAYTIFNLKTRAELDEHFGTAAEAGRRLSEGV